MASIKDAYDEAVTDDLSLVKFFVFAIPLYLSYHLYVTADKSYTAFWITAIFTFFLLFGFIIKCTTNVMNANNHVLPSFNIFNLIGASLKGLVALGPSIAFNVYMPIFINSKFMLPVQWVDITLKVIVWCIFASIFLTGFLLYTKRQKISDAYNLKIISNSCIDILLAVLFFIPQLALLNLVTTGLLTYLVLLFLGWQSPVMIYIWCMAVVFNLAVIGNYMAQIDYEAIRTDND